MLKTRKIISMFFLAAVLILSHSSCNREEVKAKNDLIGAWRCLKLEIKDNDGVYSENTKYGYIEFFEGDLFASTFDPALVDDLFDEYTPSSGEYKMDKNGLTWNFTNQYIGDISYLFQVKSISNAKLELVFNIKNNLKQVYEAQGFDISNEFDPEDEVRFTFTKLPNGIPANL
jgi:hypothetical protein